MGTPRWGHPYRGADTSTVEPELSHDEMMAKMRCQVEYDSYPQGKWVAKILWMGRGDCRAYITQNGSGPTIAVRSLYVDFKRMTVEGWIRTP